MEIYIGYFFEYYNIISSVSIVLYNITKKSYC